MNYEASLDRAMDATDSRATDGKRLRFPDPVGETDGAFTRLTNLGDIADALSRDPEHLHSAIQRQFATNGQFDGQRARYNGSFNVADFNTAIREYADEFVICSECGLPDTVLRTEDGVEMLRCEACGAFRPVQKRTSSRSRNTPTLEEGKTYEFEITGTGRKGDGVAEVGKYTVFVSGAQEGQTVRASVYNISGSLAFARPV